MYIHIDLYAVYEKINGRLTYYCSVPPAGLPPFSLLLIPTLALTATLRHSPSLF